MECGRFRSFGKGTAGRRGQLVSRPAGRPGRPGRRVPLVPEWAAGRARRRSGATSATASHFFFGASMSAAQRCLTRNEWDILFALWVDLKQRDELNVNPL